MTAAKIILLYFEFSFALALIIGPFLGEASRGADS